MVNYQNLLFFSFKYKLKFVFSLKIDSGILAITKGQLSLEYVALRKLNNLTNHGLDGIHSAFLKEIDFRWNERIQDHGILTIVSNNLNLRSIHLVNCHLLTWQSVVYIAQNLAQKLVSYHS